MSCKQSLAPPAWRMHVPKRPAAGNKLWLWQCRVTAAVQHIWREGWGREGWGAPSQNGREGGTGVNGVGFQGGLPILDTWEQPGTWRPGPMLWSPTPLQGRTRVINKGDRACSGLRTTDRSVHLGQTQQWAWQSQSFHIYLQTALIWLVNANIIKSKETTPPMGSGTNQKSNRRCLNAPVASPAWHSFPSAGGMLEENWHTLRDEELQNVASCTKSCSGIKKKNCGSASLAFLSDLNAHNRGQLYQCWVSVV